MESPCECGIEHSGAIRHVVSGGKVKQKNKEKEGRKGILEMVGLAAMLHCAVTQRN